jgi:hypothetical protein
VVHTEQPANKLAGRLNRIINAANPIHELGAHLISGISSINLLSEAPVRLTPIGVGLRPVAYELSSYPDVSARVFDGNHRVYTQTL